MSKLGTYSLYIGAKYLYFNEGIMLIQHKYAKIILERFQMIDCHFVTTPMEEGVQLFINMDLDPVNESTYYNLIGSLIYDMITQPNLSFWVNCWVLKYIKGTTNFRIFFPKNGKESIFYVNVDWAWDLDKHKLTTRLFFNFHDHPILWSNWL
jgi:hypothetical protein